MSKRVNGFEGKVLTHLEYIKKKQDEHDDKIEKLLGKLDNQIHDCDKRFDKINKDIDTAKGFIAGMTTLASIAGAGIMWLITKAFKLFE